MTLQSGRPDPVERAHVKVGQLCPLHLSIRALEHKTQGQQMWKPVAGLSLPLPPRLSLSL